MSAIYLPIRAFGDFTISASIIKKNYNKKIPVLLPQYLKPLFDALGCNDFFTIEYILELGNYSKFFQLRTVKNIKDVHAVYKDIDIIRSNLKKSNNYLLDYKDKRSALLGNNLFYPDFNDNVYTAKSKFFSQYFKTPDEPPFALNKKNAAKNIALFPGSRLASKALSDDLVTAIASELTYQGYNVSILYHESEKTQLKEVFFFNSFSVLKKLILDTDVVISADSLPIHIAYYFDKYHFVIYNNQDNSNWATPFIITNNSLVVYLNEKAEVLEKIISFISDVNNTMLSSATSLI